MAHTSLMNLDDDGLLVLLDEIQAADLVNFVLANRRVHSLAQKRFAEHQSLMGQYTIVCLDPGCTHEDGCCFTPTHPADLVEACVPNSRIFEYIKYVRLGERVIGGGRRACLEKTRQTIARNSYFSKIYEEVGPNFSAGRLNDFADAETGEKLFLWLLSRPVVIEFYDPDELCGDLDTMASIAKSCKLQQTVPGIPQWKCLKVSAGRLLRPRYLTRTANDTIHFAGQASVLCNILQTPRFWSPLQSLCGILACSLKHVHVEVLCPPRHKPDWGGDIRYWSEKDDQELRRCFEHDGSALQEVRLSGFLNRVTERSDFPTLDRLNRPECKKGSTVSLRSALMRSGCYFDLRVTRDSNDPVATEEASVST